MTIKLKSPVPTSPFICSSYSQLSAQYLHLDVYMHLRFNLSQLNSGFSLEHPLFPVSYISANAIPILIIFSFSHTRPSFHQQILVTLLLKYYHFSPPPLLQLWPGHQQLTWTSASNSIPLLQYGEYSTWQPEQSILLESKSEHSLAQNPSVASTALRIKPRDPTDSGILVITLTSNPITLPSLSHPSHCGLMWCSLKHTAGSLPKAFAICLDHFSPRHQRLAFSLPSDLSPLKYHFLREVLPDWSIAQGTLSSSPFLFFITFTCNCPPHPHTHLLILFVYCLSPH